MNLSGVGRLHWVMDGTASDCAVVARLVAGDHSAMADLLADHYVALYRFAFHLCRRTEDAEDIVQQTLVRVLVGAAKFDGRAGLRTWMFTILFREFQNYRRRKLWLPPQPDRIMIDAAFAAVVEAEALLTALDTLPAGHRAAFLLHHVEELPIAGVAAALRIPEGTVKSRLHVTRNKLRALLGEDTSYGNEPCEA